MADTLGDGRDLSVLFVPAVGAVECTDSLWAPVRVIDAGAQVVPAVSILLTELQARGRAVSTQRSYAMDLLRWFRFCWAVGVPWDQATRVEARDFCVWLSVTSKPAILHGAGVAVEGSGRYAVSTRAHAETVLRTFYDFHRDAGSGPMVNPFPLARAWAGRVNAHHNPMEPFRNQRAGLYRAAPAPEAARRTAPRPAASPPHPGRAPPARTVRAVPCPGHQDPQLGLRMRRPDMPDDPLTLLDCTRRSAPPSLPTSSAPAG